MYLRLVVQAFVELMRHHLQDSYLYQRLYFNQSLGGARNVSRMKACKRDMSEANVG